MDSNLRPNSPLARRQYFSQGKQQGSRESLSRQVANPRLDLLNEHTQKSDTNFFHLLDEAQEEWKDRLENLEGKGLRLKRNLKDQIKRELDVLQFRIEKEGNERLALEDQLAQEDQRIRELNSRLKYSLSTFQNLQDQLNYENRHFTEKLDKHRRDKEQTAT